MAQLLVVSSQLDTGARPEAVLPAIGLLAHDLRSAPADTNALTESAKADVVVIDGRSNLANARTVCRLFVSSGITLPILLVVTEGGLAAINGDWGVSDLILDGAGPAEFDARIRLLLSSNESDGLIQSGGIVIDEAAYSARLGDAPLDLTYTEFELLKYLVTHPGRVFSREHLLADVWGYDYFGGTRTVDVHIRRLRAKLGPEHESLIGTVRNVGYRFSS
ncbi:response regulator transcription factor [Micropruina sonneratiae]|uniref:response regulator transcription factor n=1 Tax=Micropruina sonneratiae TaxID=2986940 RepID=UPI0022270378|nr:response regulator transcription factor [Micropruina sp. KQZ13P-5]MCW3156654.1 response regulator transcription factor [Micropruina sp. KQZ13P-5]